MKNSVTDNEVISVISSNRSPLSIDAIASNLGVLRHTLNPVISRMINQGIISKGIDEAKGGVPVFEVIGQPNAINEALPAQKEKETLPHNVSRLEIGRRTTSDKAKAKSSDKPVETSKAKTKSDDAPAQFKPASEASVDYSLDLQILAYLRIQARSMDDLATRFGKCEETIEALKSHDLIESTYIIDQYVYMLCPENVFQKFPDLKDEAHAKAILAEPKPAQAEIKPISSAPAETISQPEPTATATESPALKPEAKIVEAEPAPARLPEVSETEIPPEPIVVRDEYAQVDSDEGYGDFNDSAVMAQISSLVKKLVQRQLLEQQSTQHSNMSAMASKIKSASASLKQAARSLDEAMELLEP